MFNRGAVSLDIRVTPPGGGRMDPQHLQELEPRTGRSARADAPGMPRQERELTAMSEAMRQLQDLIDDFLDHPQPPQARRSVEGDSEDPRADLDPRAVAPADAAPADGAPATEADAATDAPTPKAASTADDAGWDRAMAMRPRADPKRVWIEANAAFRRGEHAKAFQLFRDEAEMAAASDDHARAAIAYRMASDAAAAMGRRDDSDHDLRRAGKNYLFVAEDASSSLQTMYSSYLAASRCFLAVGNLELTQSCVARAIDLQQAINEDLHARFNSGPVTEATAT
jgi:hypothetical protein